MKTSNLRKSSSWSREKERQKQNNELLLEKKKEITTQTHAMGINRLI